MEPPGWSHGSRISPRAERPDFLTFIRGLWSPALSALRRSARRSSFRPTTAAWVENSGKRTKRVGHGAYRRYFRIFAYRGRALFRATDGVTGTELCVSDGTPAGTQLVLDIDPTVASFGPRGGGPDNLIIYRGRVFFSAQEQTHGIELWVTDGTTAGTHLFKDIFPGPPSSNPSEFTIVRGRLFFQANNGAGGEELFETNGRPRGTKQVADLAIGGSEPRSITPFRRGLLFTAETDFIGRERFRFTLRYVRKGRRSPGERRPRARLLPSCLRRWPRRSQPWTGRLECCAWRRNSPKCPRRPARCSHSHPPK